MVLRERHVRVSAEELAGLVRRIGGPGDRFLVLQRIPDLPDVFAQVWQEAGGREPERPARGRGAREDPDPAAPPDGADAGPAEAPADGPAGHRTKSDEMSPYWSGQGRARRTATGAGQRRWGTPD